MNVGFSAMVFCPTSNIQIYIDACTTRWGTHVKDTVIKGTWIPEESKRNIEMRAVTLVLQNRSKALDAHSGFHRQHKHMSTIIGRGIGGW